MKCIFCDIVKRELPAEVLFENEQVIAFLDVRPMNFGHTLVVPKQHYDNFLLLPPELLPEIFSTAQKLAGTIQQSLESDGFNLVVNTGKAAGQSVFHFHLHIIPRFREDKFRYRINFKKYGTGELAGIGEKIRKFL